MKNIRLRIDTNTFVRFWLVVICFALALGALWIGRVAILMILAAFFFTLILNRPVSFIARHLPGNSRALSTLIAYLLILLVIAFVFITIVPVFVQQVANFTSTLPQTISNLQDRSHFINDFVQSHNLQAQYDSAINNLKEGLSGFAANLGSAFVKLAGGLMGAFANALLIVVLTFLMLTEGPKWAERFWRLVYRDEKKREHHQQLTEKMYDVVSGYVSGQVVIAAVASTVTALTVLGLSFFLPVPANMALPAASIVFLTAFIPMFGATIGGVVAGVLVLLYSWPAAIIFWVIFIIYQQVENNFISPKVQSKKLNMSALMVLLAATIGIQVGGIFGAFVAIPVVGCLQILARDYLARRKAKSDASSGKFEKKVKLASAAAVGSSGTGSDKTTGKKAKDNDTKPKPKRKKIFR